MYYYGFIAGGNHIVFNSKTTPTALTHGDKIKLCVGPFRTKRGAEYAATHEWWYTPANADLLAKQEAGK